MYQPEIKELIQVYQLIEEDKLKDALQVILEIEQRDDFSLKERVLYTLIKANLFRLIGNYLDAIEYAEVVYQESQKLGDLLLSFDALTIQAHSYLFMVNVNKSEDLVEKAQNLFKIIKGTFSIDLRERESFLTRIKAGISFFKGEIQTALELNQKSYQLAKETENKRMISACLNNIAQIYFHMKEYDKAINFAKDAVMKNIYYPTALGTLIEIFVGTGDIENAKAYLKNLCDYTEKFKRNKTLYIYTKALLLKSSLRARDRIESEDLFKSIALNTEISSEQRIDAIINLCDLCLTELKMTDDLGIINEIQPYIHELLEIANHQHMYLVLAETYFLQAKLSLLTSDIKIAKKFLTQAQNIAETYGLKRLAANISNEHDKLLNQEKIWEDFKNSNVSLSERLEFAGLNEQMGYMIKNRLIENPELSDEEPLLLLIVSEGGIPFFSYSFIEDKTFEDHLFGGFFTTFNSFINEKFSEGLDRASFGKHTLLMDSISPFLMCYIYEGQSYSAQKRMKSFINELKSHSEVWDTFEKFYQVNRKVQITDIPSLEPLIHEIFIEKKLH
ncbi:MAG: tetratricopeptide repeat protein [Promethearchaeota archaeon]